MQQYGYQPNFGYPQMQNNPYLQQNYSPYGQIQQNTQPQFNTGLNEVIAGSIVDSEDVVRSKNCNLDGSATYYPLSDASAIYVKKLNPQTGAGQMFRYKLDMPEQQNQIPVEQQVATLLSSFKEELSVEFADLKRLVLEKTSTPRVEAVVERPVDSMSFMNRPGGLSNV